MRKERSQPGPVRHGFTLAELLVVIVILGLLATILTPTINSILQHTYQADTRQRIAGLSQGAHFFKEENTAFPGVKDYLDHSQNGTDYIYTGSQVLAANLFNFRHDDESSPTHNPYHILDDGDISHMAPESKYAKYESGLLATVVDQEGDDRFLTIMDCFPRPRPIVYYMATSGIGTLQFHLQQNIVYTKPEGVDQNKHQNAFEDFITDDRFSADYYDTQVRPAVNEEMFLIISPGIDVIYFNQDDAKNWSH